MKVELEQMHKMMEVREILVKDLSKHYSIEVLAHMVDLNTFLLKTQFKATFGKSIYAYLLYERMEFASKYLIYSHTEVREIALLCGYKWPTNFIAAFRRVKGETPAEHRESQRKKLAEPLPMP